jgi:hypothetical protein
MTDQLRSGVLGASEIASGAPPFSDSDFKERPYRGVREWRVSRVLRPQWSGRGGLRHVSAVHKAGRRL